MSLVLRIDNEIKELQKVRRLVVKGEKKFKKDDAEGIKSFENMLMNYDIPFTSFTYGNQLFIKIINDVEVENNQEC